MKLYRRNSARDVMVLGVWLGFLICIPLIRHVTIPPMAWRDSIVFCAILCGFVTLPVAGLGYMQDRMNQRHRYGSELKPAQMDYLDQLEEQMR